MAASIEAFWQLGAAVKHDAALFLPSLLLSWLSKSASPIPTPTIPDLSIVYSTTTPTIAAEIDTELPTISPAPALLLLLLLFALGATAVAFRVCANDLYFLRYLHLQTTLADLKTTYLQLHNKYDLAVARVIRLGNDIRCLREANNDLQYRLIDAMQVNATISSELTGLKTRVAECESTIAKLSAEIERDARTERELRSLIDQSCDCGHYEGCKNYKSDGGNGDGDNDAESSAANDAASPAPPPNMPASHNQSPGPTSNGDTGDGDNDAETPAADDAASPAPPPSTPASHKQPTKPTMWYDNSGKPFKPSKDMRRREKARAQLDVATDPAEIERLRRRIGWK